jgi:AraC family transcriptional regulator, regulatory protein of adaptative response / methylated-DNA-[protein]-cysteine methyltransferase
MNFVAYARAIRMGLAMKQIRKGQAVINAELVSGYESGRGFRNAFSRIIGASPSKSENHKVLKASWIDTPLGSMLVVADDEALYLLEFVDRRGLEKEIERLRKKTKLPIIPGKTNPAKQIEAELVEYFSGKLQEFKTPLLLIGSPFQKRVWEELQKIPKGETRSYAEIAEAIGKPSAFRAVALANGANQFAIVIPCHRVINSNGDLGGYGGGIKRKEWLLKHERK